MTHFFSKMILRSDRGALEKLNPYLLKDAYFYHQLIWRLFSDSPEKKRDFIYRIQLERGWPVFYVVSDNEPIDAQGIVDIETKRYQPALVQGQRLRFVLRVNPQVTTKRADGKKTKYDVVQHAIYGPAGPTEKKGQIKPDLIQAVGEQWLQQRAEKNGFSIENVMAHNFQKETFHKRSQEKPVTYSTLDYEGVLIVQQPELLLSVLYHGIGSAKSFGCGLLMVRP